MRSASRAFASVFVLGLLAASAGCAGSDPSTSGEPIDSSGGGPVDDDGVGDSTGSDPTSDPSSPTSPTDPTSADETGACGGCIDASGACQPGSFNEACGAMGEACQPCAGSTVCADGECLEPPSCTAENCDGCCDGNECLSGDAVDACGRGGAQCSACPADATCDAGVCNLSCADSCDGCCDGETCIELDAVDATNCGENGAVCQTCGSGLDCFDGECLSSACVATCDGCCDGDECLGGSSETACGSDGASCQQCGLNTVCGAAGCEPDPMAEWDITIIDGSVALTDENGDAWDAFNGLPDPYVFVEVVGVTGETDSADDTVFPVWNQVVLTNVTSAQLQGDVSFEVWDADATFDDSMQACVISIEDDMFGGTHELVCEVDGFEFWQISYSIDPA